MWQGNPSTHEPNIWDQSHLANRKGMGAKPLGLTENQSWMEREKIKKVKRTLTDFVLVFTLLLIYYRKLSQNHCKQLLAVGRLYELCLDFDAFWVLFMNKIFPNAQKNEFLTLLACPYGAFVCAKQLMPPWTDRQSQKYRIFFSWNKHLSMYFWWTGVNFRGLINSRRETLHISSSWTHSIWTDPWQDLCVEGVAAGCSASSHQLQRHCATLLHTHGPILSQ